MIAHNSEGVKTTLKGKTKVRLRQTMTEVKQEKSTMTEVKRKNDRTETRKEHRERSETKA